MLNPGAAAREILAHIEPLPTERLPLPEALGRVLATEVQSPLDLPAWDNSAMDGYAARSADLATDAGAADPVVLRVIETIAAGAFPTRTLGPGECARIFTGAPLPDGADSVIRQEDTTALSPDRVRVDDRRDAGRNLRRRGEDIRRGAVPVPPGTPLEPAQLGVLASMAQPRVHVHRRPRVAILGTGDEIADLDERDAIVRGRKIASSNTYTLLAMTARAGGVPENLGIARDDPADLKRRLQGLARADLLVTSAGVSVGEHDHVRGVLDELGAELKFWRIRMRPGAPVGFALVQGTPWLGLPGNPVSTMVTFELFVRPAIRKMLGHSALFRRTRPARLAEPVRIGSPLTHFLRAVVEEREGTLEARLTGPQGSGILTSMVRANALLIVPADRREVEAGEVLRTVLLDEPAHVAEPEWE